MPKRKSGVKSSYSSPGSIKPELEVVFRNGKYYAYVIDRYPVSGRIHDRTYLWSEGDTGILKVALRERGWDWDGTVSEKFRNPSPGRKSAGEQKMTFEKLHEPFKAWLSEVASEYGKPVEQVFAWWREYTRDCRNYDQSPVQSEFLDWYRDKLSASGGENPSPSAKSACGSSGGRGNPEADRLKAILRRTPGWSPYKRPHQHLWIETSGENEHWVVDRVGSTHTVPFATPEEAEDYKRALEWFFETVRKNPSDSGIKFVYGILGKGASRVSEVQSVLMDKARYTLVQAKKWLQDHGFKHGSVDEGGPRAEYLRFRQQDPGKYHSMRTGEPGAKNPTETTDERKAWDYANRLSSPQLKDFAQDYILHLTQPETYPHEPEPPRGRKYEAMTSVVRSKIRELLGQDGRQNPALGMGALPPHALIQHPSGVWSFVGRVDARLSYLRKDGSKPSEEELRKAAQFGPGLVGLKTRVWATRAEAEQAAAELGIKMGQVSPHRRGNPEAISPVIFRKFKEDPTELVAIFPASVGTSEGEVDYYVPVGGHSAAPLQGLLSSTTPASPKEYARIKEELERGYDYRLRVVEHDSPAFQAGRRKQLREYRRGNPDYYSELGQLASSVRNQVSVGTGMEIRRLMKGVDDGVVTEDEAKLALEYMREHGGAGFISWAEDALKHAGVTEEVVAARRPIPSPKARQRSRRNPESQSAAALYEQFHGRPSSETLEYREEIEVPDELAGLGDLTEIKVATMSGLDVTLSFEDDPPKLCSTPDGKQLHIIGGDGSLPLDKLKMDGQKWLRDSMVVGVLYELTYRTEKDFHRFSPTDYFHKFADPKEKRSDVEPMLIYDSVNKQLSVSGGQYKISRPGIEG
jgi:hypothetical protein